MRLLLISRRQRTLVPVVVNNLTICGLDHWYKNGETQIDHARSHGCQFFKNTQNTCTPAPFPYFQSAHTWGEPWFDYENSLGKSPLDRPILKFALWTISIGDIWTTNIVNFEGVSWCIRLDNPHWTWTWADVFKTHIRGFADSQIRRFTDSQIRRFTDSRVFNGTALKLHRRTDVSGLPNVLQDAQPQARRIARVVNMSEKNEWYRWTRLRTYVYRRIVYADDTILLAILGYSNIV